MINLLMNRFVTGASGSHIPERNNEMRVAPDGSKRAVLRDCV